MTILLRKETRYITNKCCTWTECCSAVREDTNHAFSESSMLPLCVMFTFKSAMVKLKKEGTDQYFVNSSLLIPNS